jgi:hypothetical protein
MIPNVNVYTHDTKTYQEFQGMEPAGSMDVHHCCRTLWCSCGLVVRATAAMLTLLVVFVDLCGFPFSGQ